MFTSYHVHSRWSDGQSEITDFITAAHSIGLDEIGISDHYVLTPDGSQVSWGMPLDSLDAYVEAVQSAALAGNRLTVRLGVEADFFPETAENLRDILASYPFDYVIGAVHLLDGFPIDDTAEPWEKLTQSERNDIIHRYWVRLRQMADSRLFDIAAHLDLTKKFDFRPSIDISSEISNCLDAIARAGMSIEINTAGWRKPCREVYPEPSIIQACLDRRIPVLITTDAHCPAELAYDYNRALSLVSHIGYSEIVSYARRCSFPHPIHIS